MPKTKKGRRPRDEDEDDIEAELEALRAEQGMAPAPSKVAASGNDSTDSGDEGPAPEAHKASPSKAKSGFAGLAVSSSSESEDEEEDHKSAKPTPAAKQQSVDDDDDIDDIDDIDDVAAAAKVDDGEVRIKTAADKKREKKERERLKKEKEKEKKNAAKAKAKAKKEAERARKAAEDAELDKMLEEQGLLNGSGKGSEDVASKSTSDSKDGKQAAIQKERPELAKVDVEKAQEKTAAAAATAGECESPASQAGESPAAPSDAEETTGAKKKKKKKKKKTAAEQEAEAAEAAAKTKKKKPSAAVAALRAHLEEQKKMEAELKRQEEERAKEAERIRLEEEEADRVEQERRERKKQREREKKEQLRKEGKLLTKKEKERRAMAELRRQQMIEAGMDVTGITEDGTSNDKPKKVSYGTRKRGPKKPAAAEAAKEVEVERPPSPEVESEEEAEVSEDSDFDADASVPPVQSSDEEEEVAEAWDTILDSDNEDEKEQEKAQRRAKREQERRDAIAKLQKAHDDHNADRAKRREQRAQRIKAKAKAKAEKRAERLASVKIEVKASAADQLQDELAGEDAKAAELPVPEIGSLRSPIVVVLGHVDTGKTKLLDKIRRSNVQDGEAGGITQQIGATFIPDAEIAKACRRVPAADNFELKLPGLLVIDTPGHESFSNLRSRGSSLCDIAILVVDLMHGLEPQTIESINLLKSRKTPFIVALNKIDRCHQWKETKNASAQKTLEKQLENTLLEFHQRADITKMAMQEQGFNSALYYNNDDLKKYVSLVPTSAHTGEGIPDLLYLICSLTQTVLTSQLQLRAELDATVLEVKVVDGHGTTIDCILANGFLNEGDTIVLSGLEGPIVTTIRSLLMPEPLKELRVKNSYRKFKTVWAANGVKIAAKDLEKAVAGLPLIVAQEDDDIEDLKDEAIKRLKNTLSAIKTSEAGVMVMASTLGSLEALMQFLKDSKIPVSAVNIGPVHKRDITRASVQLEKDKKYAVVLAFDVVVDRDAQRMADEQDIRIFTANIIYHLFDAFTAYIEELKQAFREKNKYMAVMPCRLSVLEVFHDRNPINVGVRVLAGQIRIGTPIVILRKEEATSATGKITGELGTVDGIEVNNEPQEIGKMGQEICIRIQPNGDRKPSFERLVGKSDEYAVHELLSKLTRESIDMLKHEYFRDDLSKDDWKLVVKMKKVFGIH